MIGALTFGALASIALAGLILYQGGEPFAAVLALLGGLVITVGLLVGFGPLKRFTR